MISCHRDVNGYLEARTEGVPSLVGSYFEQDVQTSLEFCNELLDSIRQVCTGDLDEWSGTGNSFELTIGRTEVGIECLWDEKLEKSTLSTTTFEQCVKEWKSCLQQIRAT